MFFYVSGLGLVPVLKSIKNDNKKTEKTETDLAFKENKSKTSKTVDFAMECLFIAMYVRNQNTSTVRLKNLKIELKSDGPPAL